ALVAALRADGCAVLTIGRRVQRGTGEAIPDVEWNPEAGTLDAGAIAGVEAVVHLAGAPVGQRWTSVRKRAIRESRVLGTQLIARTLARLRPPAPAAGRPAGDG